MKWTTTKVLAFVLAGWLIEITTLFIITGNSELVLPVITPVLSAIVLLITGKNYFQNKERKSE
ncbi:MAG: hypothetical protein H8D45_31005 [Bacteroidetes bacterium]|nr:hypothetical protein [Bacteroidota bacterium]